MLPAHCSLAAGSARNMLFRHLFASARLCPQLGQSSGNDAVTIPVRLRDHVVLSSSLMQCRRTHGHMCKPQRPGTVPVRELLSITVCLNRYSGSLLNVEVFACTGQQCVGQNECAPGRQPFCTNPLCGRCLPNHSMLTLGAFAIVESGA